MSSPAALAETLSNNRWRRAPHLSLLSQCLADLAYRDKERVIVSMPPRHGKSELVSKWFPFWYLANFPENKIILASYEAEFAASWGRKVRQLVVEHGPGHGVELNQDGSKAANNWETSRGGGMVTAGVGGPITGKGANLLIIDDPIKNFEEAYSATYRQRTWDWWLSTARTRLEPGGVVVIVMTRWHEDDIVGRIKEEMKVGSEHWHELRFPAIAEESDELGREPGQALWPERYPEDVLLKLKPGNSLVWAGLYQQRPAPTEGGIIKRAWLKFYDEKPKRFDEVLQSWDLTFKGEMDNDYVVGSVWGRAGANCYLLDLVREKMDFPKTLRVFKSMTLAHPQARRKLVEEAANGAALIATLKDKIPGIIPCKPRGTKEARLAAVSGVFESGNVFLPNRNLCAWVDDYIEELVSFPGTKNDDQVDVTSQALARLSNSALNRLRKIATM